MDQVERKQITESKQGPKQKDLSMILGMALLAWDLLSVLILRLVCVPLISGLLVIPFARWAISFGT